MYLTSLALLQVLGLPQNFTFYPLNNPFSIEYQSWQCQNLPSIYTQKYLKTKCPGLIGDLNVCCAVLNECLEQETENATCLTKYSTCTTVSKPETCVGNCTEKYSRFLVIFCTEFYKNSNHFVDA